MRPRAVTFSLAGDKKQCSQMTADDGAQSCAQKGHSGLSAFVLNVDGSRAGG